jgi:predicted Fe-Mo cluster-binding NifX family protein
MKIAVTLSSIDPAGQVEERFGRCAAFWVYDDATQTGEVLENTAALRSNGAGVDAAKRIIESGASAVITGRLGPNATEALKAANVAVYTGTGMSALDAVKALAEGKLTMLTTVSPGQH